MSNIDLVMQALVYINLALAAGITATSLAAFVMITRAYRYVKLAYAGVGALSVWFYIDLILDGKYSATAVRLLTTAVFLVIFSGSVYRLFVLSKYVKIKLTRNPIRLVVVRQGPAGDWDRQVM